jgi:glycosyltransferase involved in cell wall biosynthesis
MNKNLEIEENLSGEIIPNITVIITSYNYEQYIKEAIQSVLNQTYQNFELIIVDDCSTDNSVEIIKSFNDDRIRLFVNEQNQGLAKTLQRALQEAKGKWVAFLESDDILTLDNLEKKVQVVESYPNIALVFNDVELFGEKDKREKAFKKSAKFLRNKTYPCNLFYDLGTVNRILTFSAVLVNKSELLKINFNTPVDKCLDWWLFLHLARNNQFYYIPEKLTKWRMHSTSYINQKQTHFSLPISLYTLFDIAKTEKSFSSWFFLMITFVKLIPRIRAIIFKKIKNCFS